MERVAKIKGSDEALPSEGTPSGRRRGPERDRARYGGKRLVPGKFRRFSKTPAFFPD